MSSLSTTTSPPQHSFSANFDHDGYVVVPHVIDDTLTAALICDLEAAEGESIRRKESIYAIRNLFDAVPSIRELAASSAIRALVEPVLGENCFAVRSILFDKTPDANWKVVWHQDLSIAVQERIEMHGFGPWSEKAGVVHVQPPTEILQRMMTVRLHLDDCEETNGPLQVIPRSHCVGRLGNAEIQDWRERSSSVICTVPRGGAVLMRPLILHASSQSTSPKHRRVIHMEFAADELPGRLHWHQRVS